MSLEEAAFGKVQPASAHAAIFAPDGTPRALQLTSPKADDASSLCGHGVKLLVSVVIVPSDGGALSRVDRGRLAMEILVSYVRVRWWLVRGGLPHALAGARRELSASVEVAVRTDPARLECGLRLGRSVQRVLGALPADSRCLIRSLVLTRLLARRGLTSTVVFAARTQPSFEAHAWVEHGGAPLLPTGSGLHRLTEM